MISIAYRENKGATGGPGGVNYLLKKCNAEHQIFDSSEFIFKPKCIVKSTSYIFAITKKIKNIFLVNRIITREHKDFIDNTIAKYLSTVYICHDLISAFLVLNRNKKCVLVYHQQGSMYHEHLSFGGEQKPKLQHIYSKIETFVIEKSELVIFPSSGALNAFLTTSLINESSKNTLLSKCHIAYNTIDESLVLKHPENHAQIDRTTKNKKVFLTVSSLTEAKGVDLIVKQLIKIERFREDYVWILCGSGHLKDQIYTQIKDSKLEKNFIHVENRIDQNELKFYYEIADFYIMMHRHSIFDLATLEAMFNSTIPVLSKVGGNLEVDKNNNIIFEDRIDNIKRLTNDEIENLKQSNHQVYSDFFSNYDFLNRYKSIIEANGITNHTPEDPPN